MKPARIFEPGETVEVRPLPSQKDWQRAIYVRRVRADEMPAMWRGPLGHVVAITQYGVVSHKELSGHRIRKVTP